MQGARGISSETSNSRTTLYFSKIKTTQVVLLYTKSRLELEPNFRLNLTEIHCNTVIDELVAQKRISLNSSFSLNPSS